MKYSHCVNSYASRVAKNEMGKNVKLSSRNRIEIILYFFRCFYNYYHGSMISSPSLTHSLLIALILDIMILCDYYASLTMMVC